jgi:hypothetical protein
MAIDYSKMSVYGDTYGTTEQDQDQDQDQETGIGEILIPNINTDYLNQGNDNQYVNRNINYDNLKIPALQSEKRNNFFTDAMGNIKSYADKNKVLSGIMKASSFIRDPIAGIITSAIGMLPKEDPRATVARNFYGENFGTTSSGSVASGIMQGYNPVYGNDFLNKLSRGIIPESGYGLTSAIDKRIERIQKTIAAKTAKYGGTYDPTYQLEKIQKLQAVRAKEAEAQEEARKAAANRAGQIAAEVGADVGVSGGGRGSRRGDADISESSRGNYATDDTAGFFARGGRIRYGKGGIVSL